MTNQPPEQHSTDRPPTLRLGGGAHIYVDLPFTGLTEEQQRWLHLLSGKRDLWLLAGIIRSSNELDQEILDEWKNLWLIEHQHSLWIYEFSDEEKQQVFEHLKKLRAAGYYLCEFTAYENYRAMEEWGC